MKREKDSKVAQSILSHDHISAVEISEETGIPVDEVREIALRLDYIGIIRIQTRNSEIVYVCNAKRIHAARQIARVSS